jgi:LysM repeat protein
VSAGTHTVVAGDTLYGVARRYGVTVAQIQGWNGLGGSTALRVGQVLRVAAAATTNHTVVAGDTLYGVARRYGVTVAQLRSWNSLTSDVLTIGKVLRVAG